MNPRNSARPRLQREMVVDTAIAMADAEGLDAVTIRRLAQELGVTPMALYWHFSDKDALLVAIGERLWDDVTVELAARAPAADGGFDELHVLTECLISVLRRHPACASLAPLAVLSCDSGLTLTERTLTILAEQKMPPDRAAELAHFVLATAITLVSTEPGRAPVEHDEHEAELRTKRLTLASLPPDRFPHVAAMASYLVDCPDSDAYYTRGIDFIVGGIRHQASERGEGAAALRALTAKRRRPAVPGRAAR